MPRPLPRFLLRSLLWLLPLGLAHGSVTVALDTGSPIFLVRPAETAQVALVVNNPDARPAAVTVHFRVESYDGSSITGRPGVTVPAGGQVRVPLPSEVFASFGIKWVEFWTETDDRAGEHQRSSFSYLIPSREQHPGGTPGSFLFAIAYGPWGDATNPNAALSAGLAGIRMVRTPASWERLQPDAAKPIDWTTVDATVANHAAQGIGAEIIIHGSPEWAREPGIALYHARSAPSSIAPRLDAWRDFVRAAAQRYRGRALYWENWNEADIMYYSGTVAHFIQMQRIFHEEIKAVDPRARVMTSGFAELGHLVRKPGFVATFLSDAKPWFDIIAYHQHGFFEEFEDSVDRELLPLMRETGHARTPVYFTETAMHDALGERHQAETLVKKFTLTWSRGAIAHTWFNWRDPRPRTPNVNVAFRFGLHRYEGHPKAAYPALNTLTAVLGHSERLGQLAPGSEPWLFLFKSNDGPDYTLVAWEEDATRLPPHLAFRTDARAVERIDLMGNTRSLVPAPAGAVVPLDHAPAYYVFRGATRPPELLGAVLASPAPEQIAAGQPHRLGLEFRNPFSTPLELHAQVELPSGLSAAAGANLTPNATLPPGACLEAAVPVVAADYAPAALGEATPVRIVYELAAGSVRLTGQAALPLENTGLTLHPGRPAALELDRVAQYSFYHEHDPHYAIPDWKNAPDFSADLVLERSGAALQVDVTVRDDQVVPPTDTAGLTDGDGVELILRTRDHSREWRARLARVGDRPATWITVNGTPLPAGADFATFEARTAPDGCRYHVTIPDAVTGFGAADWADGIEFVAIISDQDEEYPVRTGWLAPTRWRFGRAEPLPLILRTASPSSVTFPDKT